MNGIFQLSWGDITKVVVLSVVVFGLAWLNQTYNILSGVSPEIKTTLIASTAYIIKNLFTSNKGNIVGIIPTE